MSELPTTNDVKKTADDADFADECIKEPVADLRVEYRWAIGVICGFCFSGAAAVLKVGVPTANDIKKNRK